MPQLALVKIREVTNRPHRPAQAHSHSVSFHLRPRLSKSDSSAPTKAPKPAHRVPTAQLHVADPKAMARPRHPAPAARHDCGPCPSKHPPPRRLSVLDVHRRYAAALGHRHFELLVGRTKRGGLRDGRLTQDDVSGLSELPRCEVCAMCGSSLIDHR